MAQPKSDLATISAVAQLLAVILTVAALFFARDVFIPLALGLLLSFLLSPVVNRLQRLGIPNIMAVVATAALAFLMLGGLFTLLGRELTTLVGDLPKHREELVTKARSVAGLTTGVGGSLDKLADEVTDAMEGAEEPETGLENQSAFERWTDTLLPTTSKSSNSKPHDGTSAKAPLFVQEVKDDLPLASWATTAGTVLGPLATAGLVSVFALFMLIHREDLRDRIIAVVSHGNYVTTTEALDEAAHRISRYLIAQTIINTSYGFVLTMGLMVIGATMTPGGSFPNAVLWGVLATCLRFVPYIGPTVSAVFPLAIALSVFPGYSVALAVLGLIVTMELLSNNLLEPWLYGASTGISAVAVIIAAVFWGWLWGPVGLLLSTPLTVCLVVLGVYVPRFKILSTLLGEEVEIKTSMRFYQRLLATDEHRAWEILRDHFNENHDLNSTGDQVLIPSLKRIRRDHDDEHLSETDANRLFAMAGGLIAKLREHAEEHANDKEQESTPDKNTPNLPKVVGCGAHHFSETLVLNLLRAAGRCRFDLHSIDDDTLPDDTARQIMDHTPDVVVIVVLPKGGFVQARYLCKTIRSTGFTGPVVIACIGKFKSFDKLFVRFRKAGATSMTTSFSQTHAKIHSILKHHDAVASIPHQTPDEFVEVTA
ncbi:Predicted PurR-regulated permease PerM [Neorhodopirellula lusitana]|uniref:Predicted PurR-regulated permease PerM n=1 Tax=Neorhodopirellula lusitana TaxID=445327 RepID=A0ABY1QL56_9BACT|nr:AI-2E family transporter [Neorhodopirellula lusitana]SMP72463.1 Predicted PurR-regulated permease PerM [Neorhodopirellula lusitana]